MCQVVSGGRQRQINRILRRFLEIWRDLLHLLTVVWKTPPKKENLQNCRLCCSGWPQNKTERIWKEGYTYPSFDLARELKKLWNMKVTIISIVVGAFGTVTKGLLKGLEDLEVGGRVETIQTTTLLRTARILRRVLKIWGDLLFLKLQQTLMWKTLMSQ